ncbi:MAG TPA: hypothetical protein DEP48_00765 [Persephonella sp.]|uniref:hypothetical protein n=1 Tax=Persephonella TaxID=182899 RepID=UPI00059F7DD0|nr:MULTISPECIES: hypothetical protein [Persephonella]HCB68866.1 hypothetical protein [Persephonella sp.]
MRKLVLLSAFITFLTFTTTQAETSANNSKGLSQKELDCYYSLYDKLEKLNYYSGKRAGAMNTLVLLLKMEGLTSCEILKYFKEITNE